MLILLVFLSLLCYFVPQLLHYIKKENDIKTKYGKNERAVWAVVTGASSGIGKSLTFKLAEKGINVILIAKADDVLEQLKPILNDKFPQLSFRFIGVDLSVSGDEYMNEIIEKTGDLNVSILFNNAGYLLMDNFTNQLQPKLDNIECNVTSVVKITDHFYRKMVQRGHPAAISFTASSLAFCPPPYAPIYSGGKAFLSAFAHSLAIEAKAKGVDVFVVHPGAVITSFYDNSPKLLIFKLLKLIGQTPDDVADIILRNVGRTISYDSGIFAIIAKLTDKALGPNVVVPLFHFLLRFFPDLKQAFK